MELLFLGTGTSHGVPMIACDCPVCKSDDPRNTRTRSSVLVRLHEPPAAILIDTSVDFRQQMLRENIRSIDAILLTHHHADHLLGLDDARVFSDRQGRIDFYVPHFCAKRVVDVFGYAFNSPEINDTGGLPRLNLHTVDRGPVEVCGHTVTPIRLKHGGTDVYGYRIGRMAYLTDCVSIPEEAYKQLQGLDVLVLDALRPTPHPTHFSVDEAIAEARRIGARMTYFTHICHRLDHETFARSLPDNMQPAYDGQLVKIG